MKTYLYIIRFIAALTFGCNDNSELEDNKGDASVSLHDDNESDRANNQEEAVDDTTWSKDDTSQLTPHTDSSEQQSNVSDDGNATQDSDPAKGTGTTTDGEVGDKTTNPEAHDTERNDTPSDNDAGQKSTQEKDTDTVTENTTASTKDTALDTSDDIATDTGSDAEDIDLPADCLEQDVTLKTQADLDALAGVACIHGELTIEEPDMDNISLPDLIHVQGNIAITDADDNLTVAMDNLVQLEGTLLPSDNHHLELALGSLVTAEQVYIAENDEVTADLSALEKVEYFGLNANRSTLDIDISSLANVTNQIVITGNNSFELLDLSAVHTVIGAIAISGQKLTHTIDLSGLVNAAVITIGGNEDLVSVKIGSVKTADQISVSGNPSLETIDLSALKTSNDTITIGGNPELVTLTISALEVVHGDYWVAGNEALACDAAALTQDVTVDGAIRFCGNADNSECELGDCSYAE